ncbi:hypothetical protein DFJ73DRAFT_251708 [Zopfochytrium polystomum]|nr:hypothetical protein DFJ73DRAFT_251708 [Zopfochytrium polystomum]
MILGDLQKAYADQELEDRPSIRGFVDYINAQDADTSASFWRDYLAGCTAAELFSLGPSKPGKNEERPIVVTCSTPMAVLLDQAKTIGVTVASLAKAAWAFTLRKYQRSNDVVFGQVLAGRDAPVKGVERIVGPLLNTVPCRVRFDDENSVAETIRHIQLEQSDVAPHSHVGLIDIGKAAAARSTERLFETLFLFENLPQDAVDASGWSLRNIFKEVAADDAMSSRSYAYAFELILWPSKEHLQLTVKFNHQIMRMHQALSILSEFEFTLQQVLLALRTGQASKSIWELSPTQLDVINGSSHGTVWSPPFALVHSAFESRARSHPGHIALEFEGTHMTYGELDHEASKLAYCLADRGVAEGSRVAIVMQRSLEFVVSLLAVLKAGCTAVPVESTLPVGRMGFMIKDSNCNTIITRTHDTTIVDSLQLDAINVVYADLGLLSSMTEWLNTEERKTATGNDAFVILYTSGTTGQPKGVYVRHCSATNVVLSRLALVGCSEGSRLLQFMSIGFDMCQQEIWSALSSGATLVLRGADVFAAVKTVDAVIITPTGLAHLGSPEAFQNLKTVSVIGEACTPELMDLWADHVTFNNTYGPTEATIISHGCVLKCGEHVRIGRPIPNTYSYVLDQNLMKVPVGVIGELCLGGMGLSPGYINQNELTAAVFVPDPHSLDCNAMLYRTGDLGRLLPTGEFEVIGRRDDQVKIKGYRVELGEIRSALMRFKQVSAAAVVVTKDKKNLIGFVTPSNVEVEELMASLVEALPSYMVPMKVVTLAALPTNSNGKTDIKALASMDFTVEIESIQTSTEQAIASVWAEALNLPIASIGRASSFFSLGGDSLSVIKAASASSAKGLPITVAEIFRAQTVKAVSIIIDSKLAQASSIELDVEAWPRFHFRTETMEEIKSELLARGGHSIEDAYPATPLQAGMIAATLKDRTSYVNQCVFESGSEKGFSAERLETAFRAITAKHSILRTAFVATATEGVCQVVMAHTLDAQIAVVEGAELQSFLSADAARGFELGDKYWIRVALVVGAGEPLVAKQHVVVTIHHALYDGWSLPMILGDLQKAYADQELEDRPSIRGFVDYLRSQDEVAAKEFWSTYLSGIENGFNFNLGPSNDDTIVYDPLSFALSVDYEVLRQMAMQLSVTPAVIAMAAWGLTLRKFASLPDVMFGMVVSGRDLAIAGAERIMGPLVNTLPFRISFDDEKTCKEMISMVQANFIDISNSSTSDISCIRRWCGLTDESAFNTLFVFESLPLANRTLDDGSSWIESRFLHGAQASAYPLELILEPTIDSIVADIRYNASVFGRHQVLDVCKEFDFTLQSLLSGLKQNSRVSLLWDLSAEQMKKLHRVSSGPQIPLPFDVVHKGFEKVAAESPDLIAVECDDQSLSYDEVNRQATIAACRLRNIGCVAGETVAVIMQKVLSFPAALLAVLKCSATIVPIDSKFPKDRVKFILADSNAKFVVTHSAEEELLVDLALKIPIVFIDEELRQPALARMEQPVCNLTGDDLFAIFYTSGSTGQPKGVAMRHSGASNIIYTQSDSLGFHRGYRVLTFMSVGFDALQEALWCAFSVGSAVVFPPFQIDPSVVARTVETLHLTPSALTFLGDPAQYPRVKNVAVGGEACPPELRDKWSVRAQVVNSYGPTEVSIKSHAGKMSHGSYVTVGTPVANSYCFVLDQHKRPVPLGVEGEIYIGGIGVTTHYLNLPHLQEERYILNPFTETAKDQIFKSGDMGRILYDGELQIAGRSDDQVKIKGYRIELGEISQAAMKHPDVTSCAVIVKDKKHLIGFFTPSFLTPESIREILMQNLPIYMIPEFLVGITHMPLNSNGKIDRLALRRIALPSIESGRKEMPLTETENILAGIWSAVLGIPLDEIGRSTAFFALGGDSLSVIRVIVACHAAGIYLTVTEHMKAQVLSQAAAIADGKRANVKGESAGSWSRFELSGETLAEIRNQGLFRSQEAKIEDAYPATPLQAGMIAATLKDRTSYVNQCVFESGSEKGFSAERLETAFRAITAKHSILRTAFVATATEGVCQVVMAHTLDAQIAVVEGAELQSFLSADAARGFELGDKYWIRVALVVGAGEPLVAKQHVVVTIHHALYDGWSLPMILGDLQKAYADQELEDRPSIRGFVDYINAQAEKSVQFWTEYLDGFTTLPPLVRSEFEDGDDSQQELAIVCKTTAESLANSSRAAKVTVAMLAKAGWAVTVAKFTRSSDVVIGVVMAGRDTPVHGAERMMGPMINTVPCRLSTAPDQKTRDFIRHVQEDHLRVLPYSHAGLAFIQKLSPPSGESKLFDTLFVFENVAEISNQDQDGNLNLFMGTDGLPRSAKAGTYALEAIMWPVREGLLLQIKYDKSKISRAQATQIGQEFSHTLDVLIASAINDTVLEAAWRLSPEEMARMEALSRGPSLQLPFNLVHQGFEQQEVRTPNAIAVEFKDERITYREMNEMASTLSAELLDVGVSVGTRVAVFMQRCIEFPLSVLAVLKAGATLVPIDSSFPADRVRAALLDAEVSVILSKVSEESRVANLNMRSDVKRHFMSLVSLRTSSTTARVTATLPLASDIFAIFYTSGSTGKPKGVAMPHVGAVNAIVSQREHLGMAPGRRAVQFMSVGFDACQKGMWCALSHGATLVLPDPDNPFAAIPSADSLYITPTGLAQVGHPSKYPKLRSVMTAGEACPLDLKETWSRSVQFANSYGPTEVSISSHVGFLRPGERISIGTPMPNVTAYILDDRRERVPMGTVGEIYVGGIGAGCFYVNKAELTADRFLPDPFNGDSGARMFRTGDLGTLRPSGVFEVAGRRDDQVKFRGYRVELEEISNAICKFASVQTSTVVIKGNVMVAFVCPPAPDWDELRRHLVQILPHYMVPSTFIGMENFPTNSNGKVDKLKLLELTGEVDDVAILDEPTTTTEKAIAAVWADVLGIPLGGIGRSSAFFALGGDSLSIIRAATACKSAKIPLTVLDLMKAQILSVAAAVADEKDSRTEGKDDRAEWRHIELSPVETSEFRTNASRNTWTLSVDSIVPEHPLELGGDVHNADAKKPVVRPITTPTTSIQIRAKQLDVDVEALVMSCWAMTLIKYMRKSDMVFGLQLGDDFLVGKYSPNISVPVRVRMDETATLQEFIESTGRKFRDLVRGFRPDGDESGELGAIGEGEQLYSTRLAIICGLEMSRIFADETIPNVTDVGFELMVILSGEEPMLVARYNSEDMSGIQAAWIASEFNQTLEDVVNGVIKNDQQLESATAISPAQMCRIQRLSHGGEVEVSDLPLCEIAERHALEHNRLRAVECGRDSLTYGELDSLASAFAAELASNGARAGATVALCLPLGLELPVAMLAVQKLGATAVVLGLETAGKEDPHEIVSKASVDILVVASYASGGAPPAAAAAGSVTVRASISELAKSNLALPSSQRHRPTANDISMVLLCGSDANGGFENVKLTQALFKSSVIHLSEQLGCFEGGRIGIWTNQSFLALQQAIWACLTTGAVAVFPPYAHPCPPVAKSLDGALLTPTVLQRLGKPSNFLRLKNVALLATSDELFAPALKDLWAHHTTVVNAYAPRRLGAVTHSADVGLHHRITIGRPLPGTVACILDGEGRIVPFGVVGEIFIGCFSHVKHSLEVLTSGKLVSSGGGLVGTGDHGRLLPSGDFELVARSNGPLNEVGGKLVNIDSVKAAVASLPSVTAAAVVVKKPVGLVAYFTPKDAAVKLASKEARCWRRPGCAVPAAFVGLDLMPVAWNGETDLAALEALAIPLDEQQQEGNFNSGKRRWSDVLRSSVASITGFAVRNLSSVISPSETTRQSADHMAAFSVRVSPSSDTEDLADELAEGSIRLSPPSSGPTRRGRRIVCFHGYGTSAAIMEEQLQAASSLLKSYEFICLQAPFKTLDSPVMDLFEGPYYKWWSPGLVRQAFGSGKAEATRLVLSVLSDLGKVDGLLGFSQGAEMVQHLDALAAAGQVPRTWDFSVLISCGRALGGVVSPVNIPSLHVTGSPHEQGISARIQKQYRQDWVQTIEHSHGHIIPVTEEFTNQFVRRVVAMSYQF